MSHLYQELVCSEVYELIKLTNFSAAVKSDRLSRSTCDEGSGSGNLENLGEHFEKKRLLWVKTIESISFVGPEEREYTDLLKIEVYKQKRANRRPGQRKGGEKERRREDWRWRISMPIFLILYDILECPADSCYEKRSVETRNRKRCHTVNANFLGRLLLAEQPAA